MIQESDCPSEIKDNCFLLFCGDTFLRTRDGADAFALVSSCLTDSLVCLNLETSLKGGLQKEKNVCLSVEENVLDLIPETVRIISLVNNHVSDSGNPARLAQSLERRGKVVVGPDNPSQARITLNGMDIGFFSAYFTLPHLRLSYSGTRANALERMLLESNAKRKIVNLHWGYEHTGTPAPFQRKLAHRLVDAGADIIIGHHPHVPQGWERYRGRYIFYSLGNFNFWQFDTEPTEENKWGYMVRYDIKTGDYVPILYRINENYQPFSVSGQERDDLAARLVRLSEDMRSIDSKTWFAVHYKKWYVHEFHVWMEQCRKTKCPSMILKFMTWLILPMQVWFYWHTIANLAKGSQVK